MNASDLFSAISFSLILLPGSAYAQSPPTRPKAARDSATSGDQSVAKAEAIRIRNERRAQARALLISLASDARSFREQTLRARCLARIADALWDVDAEQGRTLFRKSWEAAETADENPAPYTMGQTPPNLRGEVLKLVARRDRRLAEEFLEKLKLDQKLDDSANSSPD
ncbi:MAG: hypothetical protein QOI77_42, partial [Blastocatellia bacterium]|nr:hypothetical protein [Blastocatellia bacterium]